MSYLAFPLALLYVTAFRLLFAYMEQLQGVWYILGLINCAKFHG